MALTTQPIDTTPAITQAATELRRSAATVLRSAETFLAMTRSMVTDYTRAALAAELGADGPAMLAVYNALKSAVEAGTGRVPNPLP